MLLLTPVAMQKMIFFSGPWSFVVFVRLTDTMASGSVL